MDFSTIYQLRTKRVWWMDVIFYFAVSLLIATVFCYLIFLFKNSLQKEEIKKETAALETVGTDQQKKYEEGVAAYQKKITNFLTLLKNHEFASNAFAFMQSQTMPNIWYRQFSLDKKNGAIQLSGEADDLESFSRQVAILEGNKYVKSMTTLNSKLGESARVGFNMDLKLDQSVFSYISDMHSILATVTPAGQSPLQDGQQAPNSEKAITSFHVLSDPEVVGTINGTSHMIVVNVPIGTDVKRLAPVIVVSPGATVLPASNIPQDFTSMVVYRVTAQDGSIQSYGATAIVDKAPPSSEPSGEPSQSGSTTLITIISVCIVAVIIIIMFLSIWIKNKRKS